MGGTGQRSDAAPPGPVRAGALTALLGEIARGPEAEVWGDGAALAPGTTVGRFEIVRELGRGGFGVVYEARDTSLGRSVAFKAVRTGGRAEVLRQERLWREAEAAARLTHPNIVTLHDAGRSEHGPWLVMELLQGRTLEERVAQGHVPAPEALRTATEIARGVAHAHAQGVIHRDLKPANVFLCADGQVKVLDFGLAHAFGLGRIAGGTPAYMAPEQGAGAPEDERTDVYALGVILYRMLAGELPFRDAGNGRQAPELEVPGLPGLGTLVGRMLQAEPVRRPRDGGEVLAELLGLQGAQPGAMARGPVRARRWPRLRLAALVAAGIAAGALVAALALRRPPAAPAPGPDGRVTVAVADFANETRDPELDGLSGLLITSLEQSRALRVLTRSRMFDLLRQLGKERVERIDETLARELGKRAGIQALLLASVRRFDDVYAVELRALNPARDEYLFTVKEQVTGKRAIPEAIDRLSERTRRSFRESEGEVAAARRGVAEVTTGNLTAWEHFFRGRQALDLRRFDRAAEELKTSVAADPEFALGHYLIAVLDAWTVAPGLSSEASIRTAAAHLDTAVRLAERLPEKERLALLAWKATWEKRPEEARRLRDQAAQAYPQDKEAVFWAGDVRFHQGEVEAALPWFERALALDPDYRLVQEHEVLALAQLGRSREELEWARRWAAPGADADSLRGLGRAFLANGQAREADEAFRRASALDGRFAAISPPQALWMVDAGRAAEAEGLLRRVLAAPAPAGDKARLDRAQLGAALAAALFQQGRWREARQAAEQASALDVGPSESAARRLGLAIAMRSAEAVRGEAARLEATGRPAEPKVLHEVAIGLAVIGDVAEARRLEGAALAGPGAADVPPRSRTVLAALLAWREGRLDEADSLLAPLAAHPLVEVRFKALSVLGELQLARGQAREAAESLERARAIPWSAPIGDRPFFQGPGLYRLALARERLGDRAGARALVQELLRQWERADPDLPLLAEARALKARVAAAPAGAASAR